MFYPVESLKKGGRFYMCWVADSWPLRFAMITPRQLWSQDIRKVCDDLLEVIMIESGRPTNRFSLRLSSQLMRGLVRVYQRKVTDVLSELCMIYANVSKNVNKKYLFREIVLPSEPRPRLPRIILTEAPEIEERVEDIIQRSRNVVANVQDITLREPTLPEQQPLLNDNFGELHPEQAMQLLADKTLETMMAQDLSVAQQSVELPGLDFSADKSHDRSRLMPHDAAQMERISEHDLTLYRKSVGDELLPIGDIEKEVPEIPEMTAILPPEPPIAQEMDIAAKEKLTEPEVAKDIPMEVEKQRPEEPEVIVLEELEEGQRQRKRRRRMRGKIVDKNIKLSSAFLRSRIANIAVELRCEDSTDDVMCTLVPTDILLHRPAHAGCRLRSNLGYTLTGLFSRNLGVVVHKTPLAERVMEEAMAARTRSRVRSVLERIEEEPEPAEVPPPPTVEDQQAIEQGLHLSPQHVNVTLPRVSLADISDLPTQVIETLSQQRKRTSELETMTEPKRTRRCSYASYRLSQKTVGQVHEADKENIPDNVPVEYQPTNTERDFTSMLEDVGLADLPPQRPMETQEESPKVVQTRARRTGSDSSETPLGSLDRTKVSLGDSEKTTDSKIFIRDQWGTEGTMIKILHCIKKDVKPLNVGNLIERGPLIAGYKKIIAARCFTSILKLKQHGFIRICKDPETLEVKDIMLGPKFDNIE